MPIFIYQNANKMKKNILLIFLSVLVTLLLCELLLAIVAPQTNEDRRYLVWSSPNFRVDQFGAVTFLPNETVRTVAVYGDKVEYDVSYQTNNMGLIDHRDYGNKETVSRRLAFVGDSFTAGHHGGTPWVPDLRDHLAIDQNFAIYNLGISGTGIHHFAKLVESFAARIDFDEIVVIAILDDFLRPYWVPDTTASEIRFCNAKFPIEKCRTEKRPVGYIFAYDTPIDTIIAQADAFQTTIWRELTAISHLAGFADRAWGSSQKRERGGLPRWQQILLEEGMATLGSISTKHPDKKRTFIHLPQKSEVAASEFELDLRKDVESQGFIYFSSMEHCSWSLGMFLELDGHPNRLGYENITRCVAQALALQLQ